MKIEKVIGDNVKRARESHDPRWTMAQLGIAVGPYVGKTWTRQVVWQVEQGKRAFTIGDVFALSLALGRSVMWLVAPQGEGVLNLPGKAIEDYELLSLFQPDVATEMFATPKGQAKVFDTLAYSLDLLARQLGECRERSNSELQGALDVVGTLKQIAQGAGKAALASPRLRAPSKGGSK